MLQAELDLQVLAFQQGDKAALATLYRHFQPDLLRFARWQSGGHPVAADLVQNVWLKVMHRIGRLQDPAVFTSWLYRAVRWEILDWQKHANQRLTDALPKTELATVPADSDEWHWRLQHLSADDQLLAVLFYQHELQQQDIALIMNIPAGTVKSRLYRIRQLLAAQMQWQASDN